MHLPERGRIALRQVTGLLWSSRARHRRTRSTCSPCRRANQFENVVGATLVQDGKLVIQARSIYHVADMPPFAAKQVLEEAGRQVAAASKAGLKVEWLVSEDRAVEQLTELFEENSILITVRPFAE